MIRYSLRVIGGPWDGTPGLAWIDDGAHELPDALRVGVCPKGMHCGTSLCRPAREHVSFWLPDEEEQPPRLTLYERTDEHVRRDDVGALTGVATYVVGGLPPLLARELGSSVGEPLVTAVVPPATFAGLKNGRHDRGWPR